MRQGQHRGRCQEAPEGYIDPLCEAFEVVGLPYGRFLFPVPTIELVPALMRRATAQSTPDVVQLCAAASTLELGGMPRLGSQNRCVDVGALHELAELSWIQGVVLAAVTLSQVLVALCWEQERQWQPRRQVVEVLVLDESAPVGL